MGVGFRKVSLAYRHATGKSLLGRLGKSCDNRTFTLGMCSVHFSFLPGWTVGATIWVENHFRVKGKRT